MLDAVITLNGLSVFAGGNDQSLRRASVQKPARRRWLPRGQATNAKSISSTAALEQLKARAHVGASADPGLAIDASLVRAAYGAILRSLGAANTGAGHSWQILKSPPRLRNVHIPRVGGLRRAHDFRFGNMHLLHSPARGFIFWRKPRFRLLPFGRFPLGRPFFGNHNLVVIMPAWATAGVANAADRTINKVIEGSRIIVIGYNRRTSWLVGL